MNGRARLGIFCAALFCSASAAVAQPTVQPAPAPLVTAETEHWYQTGEPLVYAGNLYYQSGAPLYFNGIEMVRNGQYKGVPLYSRSSSTIEPSNFVFVPLPGGFVQPYERLATTGTPSFPVAFLVDTGRGLVTAYPVAQAAPPQMVVSPMAFEPVARPVAAPAPPMTVRSVGMSGSISPARAPTPVSRRTQAANGVFVEFDGARWFSSGPATNFDPTIFTRVGDLRGLPVYTARGRGATIFVGVAEGLDLVAPYSKRGK